MPNMLGFRLTNNWEASPYICTHPSGKRGIWRPWHRIDSNAMNIARHLRHSMINYPRRSGASCFPDELNSILRARNNVPRPSSRFAGQLNDVVGIGTDYIEIQASENPESTVLIPFGKICSVVISRESDDATASDTSEDRRTMIGIGARSPGALPHHLASGSALGGSPLGSKLAPDIK